MIIIILLLHLEKLFDLSKIEGLREIVGSFAFLTLHYASSASAYMERINFILKEDTK